MFPFFLAAKVVKNLQKKIIHLQKFACAKDGLHRNEQLRHFVCLSHLVILA